MTDAERIRTGIAISLFAHFLLFTGDWRVVEKTPSFSAVVRLDMESPAVAGETRPGFGMSSPSHEAQEQAQIADMKRKAFLRFLVDVDAAVHARRFEGGGTDLIGVATCRFLIFPDGHFSPPELSASSGRPRLDEAALQAIRAASGIVKRPVIIGQENIPMTLQVKYQYGLQ